jgi:hypothetical protein
MQWTINFNFPATSLSRNCSRGLHRMDLMCNLWDMRAGRYKITQGAENSIILDQSKYAALLVNADASIIPYMRKQYANHYLPLPH